MYDEDIEKTILFYLIFENEELKLSEDDFINPRNLKIFKAIESLNKEKEEINAISIKNKINNKDNEVLKYISDLSTFKYGTSLEFAYKTLKDLTKKRKMLELAKNIENSIENEFNVSEFIENQIKTMNDINKDSEREETLTDIVCETALIIEEKMNKKYDETFFTGIFDLDDVTNGLHKEELTIIGARPSVGKSSLALQIAENIAKNRLVGFISLEMSKTQIVEKLISKIARLDSYKLKTGKLDENEALKIIEATEEIQKLKLDITTSIKSIQDIELYAKRKKNKENLELLIIDYLQLVENKEKNNIREQEIASITRALKLLSLELHIPIIALSQLKRDNSNSKPTLSDLRESGAIEQDADNVIFLYRDGETEEPQVVEDITVDLQKQRAGGLVTTKVRFNKEFSTFTNLVKKIGENICKE